MQPEDLEKLVTLEMPFGKHKGCVIADLPGNYLLDSSTKRNTD